MSRRLLGAALRYGHYRVSFGVVVFLVVGCSGNTDGSSAANGETFWQRRRHGWGRWRHGRASG